MFPSAYESRCSIASRASDSPAIALCPSQDDHGRFRVPVNRVQAVKDYIVVQRYWP